MAEKSLNFQTVKMKSIKRLVTLKLAASSSPGEGQLNTEDGWAHVDDVPHRNVVCVVVDGVGQVDVVVVGSLLRRRRRHLSKKNFFWYQLGVRNEILVIQFRILLKHFFESRFFSWENALKIPMPEN